MMKKLLLSLTVTFAAVTALPAAAAAPETVGAGLPPAVFADLGVTMQSRVCGELMASLAMGGVQALKLQFAAGNVPVAQRQPVYETSAQAVVLLTMSGSLKLEERLKAGEITQAVERMNPQVHVDTAKFCQRRVGAWIQGGQVSKDLSAQAYSQAKKLMDTAFDANSDRDAE